MLIRLGIFIAVAVQVLTGQESTTMPNEATFRKAVQDALPLDQMNSATLFVLNHDEIAVPILVAEIKAKWNDAGAADFVRRAAALIVYAANQHALDAVADLCLTDEKRFSPLVGRLLDHAINREREYEIAYYAVENHPNLREIVARWVEESLSFSLADLALAKELVKREKSGLAIRENDPLVSPLPVAAKERIKTAIEKVRTEEQQQKGQH